MRSLDPVEPAHEAYQRDGQEKRISQRIERISNFFETCHPCLEFDLLGTVFFSLLGWCLRFAAKRINKPQKTLNDIPLRYKMCAGLPRNWYLACCSHSFFRKVGSPEKLFFCVNVPLLAVPGRCRSFLVAHWSLVCARWGVPEFLLVFALVTKACNKHLRAAFFVGRR